jgi:hypothetical protein
MTVLDREALVVPPEEMIWSKAYIQERERFDGADIHHLILARGARFDWQRLLRRFGDHWQVLYGHLVSFWFSFPSERGQIPTWVMRDLGERLSRELEQPIPNERLCRGTFLSRQQYLYELDALGFEDARPLEVPGWSGDQAFPRPLRRVADRADDGEAVRGGGGDADRGGR